MAEDVHELSAGYALDVLDDGERRRFEAHLAECERCRDEVDSFRAAASALAFADPAPRRAAVFSGGTTKLQLPVHRGARVAVTIEHAGGVDTPTSNPVLTVRA